MKEEIAIIKHADRIVPKILAHIIRQEYICEHTYKNDYEKPSDWLNFELQQCNECSAFYFVKMEMINHYVKIIDDYAELRARLESGGVIFDDNNESDKNEN